MERKNIPDLVRQAIDLVGDVDEPYRSIAFGVIFEKLLEESRILKPSEAREALQLEEFLASLNLRSHTDRCVAIGYYLLHSEEELYFNTKDIIEAYTLSRMPRPTNPTNVADWCAKKGYYTTAISKKEGLKAWSITRKGEEYVKQNLMRE